MVDKKMNSGKIFEWRILLGKIISDTQERRRIAHMMGVNNATLTRWSKGISKPRPDGLHKLTQATPTHRQQFLELIPQEFPEISMEKRSEAKDVVQEIPVAFFEHILDAHVARQPLSRASSIRVAIVQQILSQLDPDMNGLAASISVCVPPRAGIIRSMSENLGRGTAPWHGQLEYQISFLGIESPQGCAVSQGHPIVMHSHKEKMMYYPDHEVAWEESAIACPILQAGNVAGCLYISSTQPEFFIDTIQSIVRTYAKLLTLGFAPHEFYTREQIMLGIMPANAIQQTRLHQFQQRISQRMREMQRCRPVLRPEAEISVLQDLEDELLHIPNEEAGA